MSGMDECWWQEAFAADYLTLYAHRSNAQAAQEVAGVLPRLRAAGGLVLDACCGAGRHLVALRAAGLPVFGFDWSRDLLAAGLGAQPALHGHVARADMRRPPFARGSFAAVTLFFTAFGYFDEAQNAAALQELAALLAPGGWLLLDLPDRTHTIAELVPESRRRSADGRLVCETRRLVGERVEKTVSISGAGAAQRRYTESVRLYRPEEIAALAQAADCAVVERWASLRGAHAADHRSVYWLRRAA